MRGVRGAVVGLVAAAGLALGGLVVAAPAQAQVDPSVTGQLSLFKRVENLDTGSSEGRRELWQMHAVNTEDPTFSFDGDGLNGFQTRTIPAGTYTISESGGVAGYRFVSWDCGAAGTFTTPTPTITVPANGQVTCTVRNDAVNPTLTLVKVSSGPANANAWTLHAQGPTNLSGETGVSGPVRIGQYALSESNGPPGYTASAWVCNGGQQTSDTTVVLTLGENVTCTITNTREAVASHLLTLAKVVSGGPATTADFTLTATGGGTTVSGTSGSAAVTGVPVGSGTYALSEAGSGAGATGYAAGTWTCTAGTVAGSTLTLADADGDPTCTITNTFTGGTLTLVKEVVGGAVVPAAWTLTATGPVTISGRSGLPAVTGVQVPAGTYTLSESGPANYAASPWSCTSGGGGTTVTVTAGASITCTITNTIELASLTLVKVVDNAGGGSALPSDFTLTGVDAADGLVMSGPAGSPGVTNQTVPVGSTWALSESAVPGYAAGTWSCTGATATGSTVTITAVADVVCAVTNTWRGGFVTLVKVVADSSAPPTAFTLTAAGPVTVSGATGTAAVTHVAVPTGDYALSEQTIPGFAAGAWTCGSAATTGTTVTVTEGEDVECTVTNSATQPHLTLLKFVDNSAGGTLPASTWTLVAAGPTTVTGVSGTPPTTLAPIVPGTYALSESPGTTAGYTASPWVCTSSAGRLVQTGSSVTIPDTNGDGTPFTDDVTCSVTNTATAPRLTLVKLVDNAGGGQATSDAFVLIAASSQTAIAGSSGTPAVTDAPVPAGTYALLEIGRPNYASSGWTCTDAAGAGVAVTGGAVTLGLGGDVRCTVTNTWTLASVTLVAVVVGGPAAPTDWTLVDAPASGGGFAGRTGTPSATGVVQPGVQTLGEVPLTTVARLGYEPRGWTCDGGHSVTGASFTIAAGESVTCTVVNVWIGSTLTLTKSVVGGGALASAWTLTADGPQDVAGASGSAAVSAVDVVPGDYTLGEAGPAGYDALGWTCDGATVSGAVVMIGRLAEVSCVATNRLAVAPEPTPEPVVPPGDGSGITVDTGGDAGVLAATGTNAGALAALGLVVVALGGLAVLAARRRRA